MKRLKIFFAITACLFFGACSGTDIQGPQGEKGEPGEKDASCSVKTNADGTGTIICPDGSSFTIMSGHNGDAGSDSLPDLNCYVAKNDDGSATVFCPADGSSFTITNGKDGDAGSDGLPGLSCYVVTNDDGSGMVFCPADGSSYVINSGNNNNTYLEGCATGYYGEHCEWECPRNNGLYCYGFGKCYDGKEGLGCMCDQDWLTTDCHVIKPDFGLLTDNRGEKEITYKTVQIGNKEWMAENLRYAKGERGTDYFSADGNSENDAQYGYYYTWDAATDACPSGWRLPSKDDFEELLKTVEFTKNSDSAFLALIANSPAWINYSNEGGDDFGFNVLPAGAYLSGTYTKLGIYASFWASTDGGSSLRAYHANFNNEEISVKLYSKVSGFSVRCLRDIP